MQMIRIRMIRARRMTKAPPTAIPIMASSPRGMGVGGTGGAQRNALYL